MSMYIICHVNRQKATIHLSKRGRARGRERGQDKARPIRQPFSSVETSPVFFLFFSHLISLREESLMDSRVKRPASTPPPSTGMCPY